MTTDIELEGRAEMAARRASRQIPAGHVETNVKQALTNMQNLYFLLSTQAQRMIDIGRQTGRQLPASLLSAYGDARKDYLAYGASVFHALGKKNLHVEQIVYRQGRPVVGPDGHVKTLAVDAPLRPPAFSGMAGEDEVGFVPVAVGAYAIGTLVVKGIVALGLGYIAVKALEQIVILVRGYNVDPAKKVDSFLKVYEKLRKDGVPPAEAAKQAGGQTEPPPGSGDSGPGLFATIAILLGVGGAAYYFSRGHRKAVPES